MHTQLASEGHNGLWPCALGLRPPPRRLKVKARGPPEEAHASLSLSLFLFQVGSSLLSLACGLRAPLLSSRRLQLFRAFMDGKLDPRPTFQVTLLPIGPLQCNHSNFESSLKASYTNDTTPLVFFSTRLALLISSKDSLYFPLYYKPFHE